PNILTPRSVAYASFTPTDGWFIRFSNGTVQWAQEDMIETAGQPQNTFGSHKMGSCFHGMIQLVRQQNPQRQEHCIDFLTFGYGSALLVRYENGNFNFFHAQGAEDDCDAEIDRIIEEKKAEQWSLGGKSRLCWWDKRQYFLEFVEGAQYRYHYNMGDEETVNLVTSIVKGEDVDWQAVQFSRQMHWVCNQDRKIVNFGSVC
ncbi:MAG: hypothetical protein Q9214_005854, partial [Letrouitia sp. 1 TL-2023]